MNSRWLPLRPRRRGASLLCCLLLAACAGPQFGDPAGGDLRSARLACNAQYPQKIGNYLPHALCVNAAVERYALSVARHPDLIRRQAQLRAGLSDKIDRRGITPQAADKKMREADTLVAAAERDRDAGRDKSAQRKAAALDAMLR